MSKIITYANLQTFKRKNDEKTAADIAAAKAALIGAGGDTVAADTIRAAKAQASGALSAANSAYALANSKYAKPADGIPKSDLSLGVQAALDKASVSIQEHQKIATGSSKGTISVDGKDVAVNGLGNMAYKDSVSKSDVGLGSVVNAGQDSTPTASSNNYVTSGGVKSYVDAAISSVKQFQYEVVTELPTAAAATMGKIYLVKHAHSSSDSYDEYITIQSNTTYSWEKIGNTDIDLSGYFNTLNWSVYDGKYPDSIRGVVIHVSQEGSKLIVHEKSLYSSEFDVTDLSGSDINFISNISQDRIGKITAKYKQVRLASQSQSGLMNAADKTKLDGITEATDKEIESLFS